jgi:hypothetical protein
MSLNTKIMNIMTAHLQLVTFGIGFAIIFDAEIAVVFIGNEQHIL